MICFHLICMKRGMESLPQFVHLWHDSYKRSLTDTRSFVLAQADSLGGVFILFCFNYLLGRGLACTFVLFWLKWYMNDHELWSKYWTVLIQGDTSQELVCLFVWSLSSHSRIFHSYGVVTITDEGLQILTYMYARHSWLLSSEGSLACHTFCDTGHPL